MSSANETKTVKTVKTITSTSGGQAGTTSGGSVTSRSESSSGSFTKRGPITASKTVVINRSLPGSLSVQTRDSVDSAMRVQRSYTAASSELQQTTAGLNNMLTGREKEKKDMRELNERFASYIEKVRFLEAQNRKLSEELQKLRDSWGKETEKVRSLYETELAQLRKLLEDADQYKATMEVRVTTLEDQLNEMEQLLEEANRVHANDRDTIDKLNQQMADYDGEISLLRRRVASFDDERARDQAEIKRLRQDVARLRGDLDTETLNHINAENSAQSLREELEFLRALHDSELKELSALAYRDTTSENREFWKNEMAQALHEIQREYDSKLDVVRSEMESQYSIKVQEARTSNTRDNMELTHLKEENRRIKSQIGDARNRIPELEARNAQLEREIEDLRRELEETMRSSELEKNQLQADLSSCNATLAEYLRELQTLMDAKLSLELEIHAYRKLLEGEEIRINQTSISSREGSSSRTTTVIEQQTSSSSEMSQQQQQQQQQQISQQQARQQVSIMKGSMTAKTSAQRTSKGSITIQECDSEGKFVTLEFTGKKKEDLSDWTLVRNVDNEKLIVKYTFPKDTVMDSGNKTIKIWAKGQRPADSKDLEMNDQSWGMGSHIVTLLSNADGEEKATHTQKTTYSTE
ncbi:hypothetical protein BOX15_Mlig002432g3 [Macrostomum lignano]|uniref:IF rod domain-containing protein n=1 Tax=Macrostomum lignano TaxID=282301 RepID=A0A267GZY0_9PLAT|nr:hypothetical protein BOX15_Mlig002432g3 [Macrostomum lignano]